jgi:anti-sigma factor RsiW
MSTAELTCKEIVEIVTDYLEGALPRDRRRAFEAHLAACDGCTEYVRQMRETIRLAGELSEESLEPGFRMRLLDAFRGLPRDGL